MSNRPPPSRPEIPPIRPPREVRPIPSLPEIRPVRPPPEIPPIVRPRPWEGLGASGYPQKPGEKPQKPGPYEPVDPKHRPPGRDRDINMPPGHKPLPPTQKPGEQWVPKR